MLLALPVALLAGLVSFFSPCVVPLLPGYLSYATGLGAAEVVEGTRRRGRMLAGTSLFVLGIAAVFVVTGAVIGSAGVLRADVRRHDHPGARRADRGAGADVRGGAALGRRELRIHRLPAVGVAATSHCFWSSSSPSAGPRAWARRRRRLQPGPQRGDPRPGRPARLRLRPGPGPALRRRGPPLHPHVPRGRLPAASPDGRDAGRWHPHGGRRPAARHRAVDDADRRPPSSFATFTPPI